MSTSVNSVTSHFPSAENGFSTTTAASVSSGATTVELNSLAGYEDGEVVVFVIDPTDAVKKQTFTGIVDSANTQITSVVWTAGTNQDHILGATVVDYATATHISMISKGLSVQHNQDGTHKNLTTNTLVVSSGTTLPAGDIVTADIADKNVTGVKLGQPVAFGAKQSTSTPLSATTWATIRYDTELYDYGSNYNAGTYEFTAPYDGVYHLGASTGFVVGNERALVALWKNGVEIARSTDIEHQESSPTFEFEANNVSCDLLLSAGDIVVAKAYTDDGFDTSANTVYGNFFYGHLIGRTD